MAELKDSKATPRTVLGMIDLTEKDIASRQQIFEDVEYILKLRDAKRLDTPIMELYKNVENLYGDEFNKLVYTLDDDTEHKSFLRYDLTVPLARYVGMNGLQKFRRYQYGKVYRRDDPQISKRRYREFHQLDYDIVGDDKMSGVNDLEMLETMYEIFETLLPCDDFTIKVNYRDIVQRLVSSCMIPEELHKVTFSALDKLDKKSWNDVEKELYEKGLDENMVLNLFEYYSHYGELCDQYSENNDGLIDNLKSHGLLSDETEKQINMLSKFLKRMGSIYNSVIQIDPFLVRGMDYYTGIIFETIVTYPIRDKDGKYLSDAKMTISAGGRYDNMIGEFSNKGKIPAIGMSIGVDRIVQFMNQSEYVPTPDIYVASIGKDLVIERVALCSELRKLDYYVVMSDLENPKMRSQFSTVFEGYKKPIPVMVVIGENEIKNNTLTIKDVAKSVEKTLPKSQAIDLIKLIIDK